MQLSTIEFTGYKRLANATCNVDGPVIAFIGPNESGKSSVLRGLAWLTDPEPGALPSRDRNRLRPPGSQTIVVRAKYRLEKDDLEALKAAQLELSGPITSQTVTEFRFSRRADGTVATGVDCTLARSARPFEQARQSLSAVRAAMASGAETEGSTRWVTAAHAAIEQLDSLLDPGDPTWSPQRVNDFSGAVATLKDLAREVQDATTNNPALEALASHLADSISPFETALESAQYDPQDVMRSILRERVPRFILFSDSDRELRESYNLADKQVRSMPPAPLRNLLAVAGTTVQEIWDASSGGDPSVLRTLARRVNETLETQLRPMWTQAGITIELTINHDGVLEVNIKEIDSPEFTVTPIEERSDGLRTFLGLACFLVAAKLDVQPILLIDEAERNLHYDAQADLIRVLTHDLAVSKVIYTTHSPGCLPLDLGTGIRVVSRGEDAASGSVLENNFWTKEKPGFSHLLFAMGAGAAAFSALRRAVLAEGVSEMILLPTLLRRASRGKQLDFHVAYGLSNMSASQAIGSTALITAFLVDGDVSGDAKRAELMAAGVPQSHIFQLPRANAIEDLIDRTIYLRVVNDFLAEQGKTIPASALAEGLTVAKAVDNYAREHLGLDGGVSHKIIAFRLAQMGPELKLTTEGRKYLADLRHGLEKAFKSTYLINGDASR